MQKAFFGGKILNFEILAAPGRFHLPGKFLGVFSPTLVPLFLIYTGTSTMLIIWWGTAREGDTPSFQLFYLWETNYMFSPFLPLLGLIFMLYFASSCLFCPFCHPVSFFFSLFLVLIILYRSINCVRFYFFPCPFFSFCHFPLCHFRFCCSQFPSFF